MRYNARAVVVMLRLRTAGMKMMARPGGLECWESVETNVSGGSSELLK